MPVKISAIVCTFNRARFLDQAVESLADQSLDRRDYEILVVDNGSKDETRRLVEEKIAAIPNLRYLHEPRMGLSIARNLGVANATGDLIAFLDDDAIACPDWLNTILECFSVLHPSPGLVCGPVAPIWSAPRPSWLKDEFLGNWSVLDWSPTRRQLKEDEWVAGANFALPKDVLLSCGGFDESLGRRGRTLLSGEDTKLTEQIRSAGHQILFDPAMAVEHHIHANRLSKSWLYRRAFWGGVSKGILESDIVLGKRATVEYTLGRAKRVGRDLLSLTFKRPGSDQVIRKTHDISRNLGRIYGILIAGRHARASASQRIEPYRSTQLRR